MYQKITILNKSEHSNLKFKKIASMEHAAKTANVPLTLAEFFSACKSQPILFVKTGDDTLPTALLGIRNDENLFLDARKNWLPTEYCPFFLKRYPFIFVKAEEKFTLAYDSECISANEEEGEAVFGENGEQTEFIKKIMEFMNKYQADSEVTVAFGRLMDELELFEPFEVNLSVGTNKYQISDFRIIGEKKFNELPTEKKTMLIEKGFYNIIVAHLISLSNIEKLAVLQSMRIAEAKNA